MAELALLLPMGSGLSALPCYTVQNNVGVPAIPFVLLWPLPSGTVPQ
mgnify:CR=1 FL=1